MAVQVTLFNLKMQKMKITCYHVNAFVDGERGFKGNAACVVALDRWLPDGQMLKLAKDNGVAETTFFIRNPEASQSEFSLRWFTPDIEMDLCGHATLATACTIASEFRYKGDAVTFSSNSGQLRVAVEGNRFTLDFPSRPPQKAVLPEVILESLSIKPVEVTLARDYVLLYEREADIRNIEIDRALFDRINLDPGGVVVTAPGDDCDFVSRFFTPQATILEDPVTGSAHCSLIPYWSVRTGKKEMTAHQLSAQGGTLWCKDCGNRVLISGKGEIVKKTEIIFA